jgi:hypothetical protein
MNQEKRKISVSGVVEQDVSNQVERNYDLPEVEHVVEKKFDDTQVFEWDAMEFEYHAKSDSWRWGLIVAVVVLVIVLAIMQNWLGIVLVMVAGFVVYQYAYKQPRSLHYILTKDGLVVDDKIYTFDKITSFWISRNGGLNLNTKWWPPRLSIELNSVDVEKLDSFLVRYVQKEKREEADTTDNISRWLKF